MKVKLFALQLHLLSFSAIFYASRTDLQYSELLRVATRPLEDATLERNERDSSAARRSARLTPRDCISEKRIAAERERLLAHFASHLISSDALCATDRRAAGGLHSLDDFDFSCRFHTTRTARAADENLSLSLGQQQQINFVMC